MSQPPCGGRGSGVRPKRERGGDTDLVRVLLVDDEERMVTALRRGLAAEGFVTESAGDGLTGLALAREGDFDAVVLDVMLPGISGYEVVRRLRADDNWVPVLMLSAKDGEYDQADALDDGADDYLTKPFSFVVLLARIRALLRRGAVVRSAEHRTRGRLPASRVRRFWRLSLRARLMIIGLTGLAVALVLGGFAFYAALTA